MASWCQGARGGKKGGLRRRRKKEEKKFYLIFREGGKSIISFRPKFEKD